MSKFFSPKLLLPLSIAKSALFVAENRILYAASKLASPLVQPPKKHDEKEIVEHMRNGVIKIHEQDLENVEKGHYPLSLLKPRPLLEHLMDFPSILLDSLFISRRRKNLSTKEVKENTDAPEYAQRNYHFQTDGYFSLKSAKFYEHQVEILFSGTAAPMRRMLIKDVKEHPQFKPNQKLRILEIAAGTGGFAKDLLASFTVQELIVSDMSEAYLQVARSKFQAESKVGFVKALAEQLPFIDETFDLVVCVYLFHEVPRATRHLILREANRILRPGGLFAVCDSIQKDDVPVLNGVVENFPKDYHEPFYKDYSLHSLKGMLEENGFVNATENHYLLSKVVVGLKEN